MFKPTLGKDETIPTAFKQADIRRAYRDTVTGRHALEVKVAQQPERLSNINIAGYTLLRDALDEMSAKETAFAAQMYAHKYDSISEKQARWLNKLLEKFINISLSAIDA